MKLKTKGITYLVLSLFTGALMPIMLELAKGMSLTEFFMLTYIIALPFALMIMLASRKQGEFIAMFRDKRRLSLTAIIGLLSYLPIGFFIMLAERYVTASLATVVFRISPLLMLIFLPIVLRERLSKSQIIALVLAFVGIFIAMTGGTLGFASNANLLIVAFLAFGALAYALASVLAKKFMFDMASGIAGFNLVLFVFFGVLFVATGAHFTHISALDVVSIIYIAIANNVIGFYTYFIAFRTLRTTIVTNTYFFSPFLTFIFAAIILGEAIRPYYIVIALLVIAGLLIQRFDVIGGTYKQKHKTGATIFDVTSAFVSSADPYIYSTIKNGGRVLAIKLDNERYSLLKNIITADRLSKSGTAGAGAMILNEEDTSINDSEMSFIREIVGISKGERIILSAGSPEESEETLYRLAMAGSHAANPGDEK